MSNYSATSALTWSTNFSFNLHSKMSFKLLPLWVIFLLLLNSAQSSVDYIHCLGEADLGGLEKTGFFFKTCVHDELFEDVSHAWNFQKALIKDTTFKACKFQDTHERKQNFAQSTWINVTFADCDFGYNQRIHPNILSFHDATFQRVTFDGCTFHESQELMFSKFYFSRVTFNNCTFKSTMRFSEGRINRMTIQDSLLGRQPDIVNSTGRGDFYFSKIGISWMKIDHSTGTGDMRFQEASLNNLEIYDSTFGSITCHEPLEMKILSPKVSTLNETHFQNVAFVDGFYCGHGMINQMELHNVMVENKLDLSNSQITNVAIINATSYSDNVCSDFGMEQSTVFGAYFKGVRTSKVSLANSLFVKRIMIEGHKLSKSIFDLEDASFSQERINHECCTDICKEKGCKCDASILPKTGCERGTARIRLVEAAKTLSCFPKASVVHVQDDDGVEREIALGDLQHGQRVVHIHGNEPSDVYFFGHKTASTIARFRVLRFEKNGALYISNGHLLPVKGRGEIAARHVMIGDELFSSKGEMVAVIDIQSIEKEGMYAPVTLSGKLSVDGIQVSSYTEVVDAHIAHRILWPLRALYRSSEWGRKIVQRVSRMHEIHVMGAIDVLTRFLSQ